MKDRGFSLGRLAIRTDKEGGGGVLITVHRPFYCLVRSGSSVLWVKCGARSGAADASNLYKTTKRFHTFRGKDGLAVLLVLLLVLRYKFYFHW